MQNRDRNRSDEDRSRGDRTHEEMRGNQGRSPGEDRSSLDSKTPRSDVSESGYSSSSTRSRHITGEGEPIDESGISSDRERHRDSWRSEGNGRTDRS